MCLNHLNPSMNADFSPMECALLLLVSTMYVSVCLHFCSYEQRDPNKFHEIDNQCVSA